MTEKDDAILQASVNYYSSPRKTTLPSYFDITERIRTDSKLLKKINTSETFVKQSLSEDQKRLLDQMIQSMNEISWELEILFLFKNRLGSNIAQFVIQSMIDFAQSCKGIICNELFSEKYVDYIHEDIEQDAQEKYQVSLCNRIINDLLIRLKNEHNAEQISLINEDIQKVENFQVF